MPWQALSAPSIQLGTLQAVLHRAGIPCQTHSMHLKFMEFLCRAGDGGRPLLTTADYQQIGDFMFMQAPGEWVFAIPPIRQPNRAEDKRHLARLRAQGLCGRLLKRLQILRAKVPVFLDECASEILDAGPSVVGFTTTFGQTIASLSLAALLKKRDPCLTIVFGGANCEGSMGEALHRSYDCIDIVVRGEGERVVPQLLQSLVSDQPVPSLPGLCYRAHGRQVVVPELPTPAVQMDEVPAPDYGEYFDRLERSSLASEIQPVLPYESSRGCWWGEKSHCTFCGLNGDKMTYRSKSPDRVETEILELAARNKTLDFTVVDSILDQGYLKTVLPKLQAKGLDIRLFYQTKANLGLEQIRTLRDSGVRTVRPGIESLSTPTLQLMRKGVTALKNIRLLKWCAQFDIHVAWNLLYGLPGESAQEYERMARLIPSLVHFSPPSLSPLTVDRFSPYYESPGDYGIQVLGPPPHYRTLYDVDEETRTQLAWTFEYSLPNGQRPEVYVAALRSQVARWRQEAQANKGALSYRRGPSFLLIDDSRSTVGARSFTLDDLEARVYLACDAGSDAKTIASEITMSMQGEVSLRRVQEILEEFTQEQLVYEEGGQYLSLAIAASPPEPTRNGESQSSRLRCPQPASSASSASRRRPARPAYARERPRRPWRG